MLRQTKKDRDLRNGKKIDRSAESRTVIENLRLLPGIDFFFQIKKCIKDRIDKFI